VTIKSSLPTSFDPVIDTVKQVAGTESEYWQLLAEQEQNLPDEITRQARYEGQIIAITKRPGAIQS
jgi:hypothetical protein